MEENEIELETVVIDANSEGTLEVDNATILPIIEESQETNKVEKLVRFPITRIKHLVKMDPDVNLCSQEALFLITKTTVFCKIIDLPPLKNRTLTIYILTIQAVIVLIIMSLNRSYLLSV